MRYIELIHEFLEENKIGYEDSQSILRAADTLCQGKSDLTLDQVKEVTGDLYFQSFSDWLTSIKTNREKPPFHKSLMTNLEQVLQLIAGIETHTGGYFSAVNRLRQVCIDLCSGHIPDDEMAGIIEQLKQHLEQADKKCKRVLSMAILRLMNANN